MRALAAGDEAALAALMGRYRGPLYAFLSRYLGSGSADADDLFQETWLRVVRNAGRYDPKRRFSTWLFQIALNLCRDRARRAAVRAESLHEEFSELDGGQVTRDGRGSAAELTSPEAQVLRRRRDEALRAAVAALPEGHREVLLLRFFEELSEAEVAEVIGIPKGTVKSRLHNAVRKLRNTLAP